MGAPLIINVHDAATLKREEPEKPKTMPKLTDEQRSEIEDSTYNRKAFRFWQARIRWQQRLNPFARQFSKVKDEDGNKENAAAFFLSAKTAANLGESGALASLAWLFAFFVAFAGSSIIALTDQIIIGGILLLVVVIFFVWIRSTNAVRDGYHRGLDGKSLPPLKKANMAGGQSATDCCSVLKQLIVHVATPFFSLGRLVGYHYMWFLFHDVTVAMASMLTLNPFPVSGSLRRSLNPFTDQGAHLLMGARSHPACPVARHRRPEQDQAVKDPGRRGGYCAGVRGRAAAHSCLALLHIGRNVLESLRHLPRMGGVLHHRPRSLRR